MLDINSITPTLLAILFVLIATLYLYFKKTYSYWEQRKIPYLKPVVPFGNFQNVITRNWTLGQGFGEAYLELKKLGVKHGGIFAFNKPVYIPVDKEIIKHLLISDADNFPNHGLYINQQDDPLSTHIFNMEGNRWKDIRTKLPQAFTSAKMRQMFNMILDITEQFQKYLDSCIEKYPDGINIKDELAKFTVEVISTCGFGLKSNTMKGENQELMKHTRLFFDYQWNILKNIMVFAFPRNILKALNFRIFRKDSTKFVKEMFEDLQKYRKGGNVQRDDLANTILKLTEKNDAHKDYSGKNIMEPLDSKEYIAQMWVFFCASFETSSSTLTFALYELTKNPECMTKLRQEIKEVLAKNNNKITYDAIMDMKYLECVIDGKLFFCFVYVIFKLNIALVCSYSLRDYFGLFGFYLNYRASIFFFIFRRCSN